MAHYGLKISKPESPDKTPYTLYYPHDKPLAERVWNQPYFQVVSIDPARKNYAMRIERRYHNGNIIPIVFDKVSIECVRQEENVTICDTYTVLNKFLDKYSKFYEDCHYIIVERQLPQNYKASRIAQHTLTYFMINIANKPNCGSIIEIDPKLKGRILGAPKNISDKQLKTWAVQVGRDLLTARNDIYSLGVMDHFRNKQDDLADTVCQIEALFISWGLPATRIPMQEQIDIRTIKLPIVRPEVKHQQKTIILNNVPTRT